MNSLNDEVCEYNSEPVTENFRTCEEVGGHSVDVCRSKCGIKRKGEEEGQWYVKCIDP